MRRFALAALALSILVLGAAAPAQAQVPRHLHCMTNASADTHAIAGGLTRNAPQSAFENFHFGVHLAVFVQGPNPNTLMPSFTGACG
jgi:hypothetical protein